jgi:hypothetical protein
MTRKGGPTSRTGVGLLAGKSRAAHVMRVGTIAGTIRDRLT